MEKTSETEMHKYVFERIGYDNIIIYELLGYEKEPGLTVRAGRKRYDLYKIKIGDALLVSNSGSTLKEINKEKNQITIMEKNQWNNNFQKEVLCVPDLFLDKKGEAPWVYEFPSIESAAVYLSIKEGEK